MFHPALHVSISTPDLNTLTPCLRDVVIAYEINLLNVREVLAQ